MRGIDNVAKSIFILYITLIILSGFLAPHPKALSILEDRQIFVNYMNYIQQWRSESKEVVLEKTALYFLGSPYVEHSLDKIDIEVLTVNLREFDCFTFVETVIALTLTTKAEEPTYDTFTDILNSIRYRDNEIAGYQSRLHYTTDWIYENEKNGVLKNISGEIGGVKNNKVINFMSSHRNSYKQLENDNNLLNEIIKVENHINERDGFYYLPKEMISLSNSLIPQMSIVGFTTNIEGLDVTHVGFSFRNEHEIKFIHASSTLNEVVVDKQSLSDYCSGRKTCTGVVIAKVL